MTTSLCAPSRASGLVCAFLTLVASGARAGLPRRAAVGVYLEGPRVLVANTTASYRVVAHWASGPNKTGPLPGAQIHLKLDGKPVATAISDASGSAQLGFAVSAKSGRSVDLVARVVSSLGQAEERVTLAIRSGGEVVLTTDKTRYQPGQTIHIRALAQRLIDRRSVAYQQLKLTITDPKNNLIFSQTKRTSRFGIAAFDFDLAEQVNLGSYHLHAAFTDQPEFSAEGKVEVLRYQLPKIKLRAVLDKPYYQPGERVRLRIEARYFFGKPVRGVVRVNLRHDQQPPIGYSELACSTDKDGRCEVSQTLPTFRLRGDKQLWAEVTIVDGAGQQQATTTSRLLTADPLRLSVVSENANLVQHVKNRLHVLAHTPDGRPLPGAILRLRASRYDQTKRADALGSATFWYRPPPLRSRDAPCLDTPIRVLATANGHRREMLFCLRRYDDALLVRPRQSLVDDSQPLSVDVLTHDGAQRYASGNNILLDLVKAGQIQATLSAPLRGGLARFALPAEHGLRGLLELRAYRLRTNGSRIEGQRMIYIGRRNAITLTLSSDKAQYRPGERATISAQVNDSTTGDGVEAAFGLRVVDEAALALGKGNWTAPLTHFAFSARQLKRPGSLAQLGKLGGQLDHWLLPDSPEQPTLRLRAADLLMSAIAPAQQQLFRNNPWLARMNAWRQQARQISWRIPAYVGRHSAGVRGADGNWRFAANLIAKMVAHGVLKPSDQQNPWKQPVTIAAIQVEHPSLRFAQLAASAASSKLRELYRRIDAAKQRQLDEASLPREKLRFLAAKDRPYLLKANLLERMVALKLLKRHQIRDPWGTLYRVVTTRGHYINAFDSGFVSRTHLRSAGPDQRFGTKDDIVPEGNAITVEGLARLGRKQRRALRSFIKVSVSRGRLLGGLGMSGYGSGGGGVGYGALGLGSMGTIGSGAGTAGATRSHFPETLFWQPELVTDASGKAQVAIDLADSITTWKLQGLASTVDGRIAAITRDLRVFQDFFIDIELPSTLTVGDQLHVPVTVYNYQKTRQVIALSLRPAGWYIARGPRTQTITLEPGQVGVRHFPILATGRGDQRLTVIGQTGNLRDAVEKSTTVQLDGVERAIAFSGTLEHQPIDHRIAVPAQALGDSTKLALLIYPGPMSQTLEGLEGMLRQPGGCFEQTSSSTYPNLLLLDYLKKQHQTKPALIKRARKLVAEGYQRLLTFEVHGGGFSWFGNAPAHQVLTAYGLMEFSEMSRVHTVDPRLIRRTQHWLANKQLADGSFAPDRGGIREGAINRFTADKVRITAYIANALQHSGYKGPALSRARNYVQSHVDRIKDPYTLAVVGNLFGDRGGFANTIRQRLWRTHKRDDQGIFFEAPKATLTHGGGISGQIETSALAALALIGKSGRHQAELPKLFKSLVASRDRHRAWHSTQATILALRALLAQRQVGTLPVGTLRVALGAGELQSHRLTGEDRTLRIDLPPPKPGSSETYSLSFSGRGSSSYQLVQSFSVPNGHLPPPASKLAIATQLSAKRIRRGDAVTLHIKLSNSGSKKVAMPMVIVPLPPGLQIEEQGLTRLLAQRRIEKVQQVEGRALFYLSDIDAGQQLDYRLPLTSAYPLSVRIRTPLLYEYYRPENRAEGNALRIDVL